MLVVVGGQLVHRALLMALAALGVGALVLLPTVQMVLLEQRTQVAVAGVVTNMAHRALAALG